MTAQSVSIERFPRGPLLAAGGMVILSLLAATAGRLIGSHVAAPDSNQISERTLRFTDRADGGIDVFDAVDGSTIYSVLPGTNGFVRALMRGLASERKHEGIGPSVPFTLHAWSDGRLTLDDPATRRHVELAAFGETNEGAFAQFLPEGGVAR